MSKSHAPAVRALLRANPDGLTVMEMSDRLRIPADILRNTVNSMPDKYVDRWRGPNRGQYAAVFCVVTPPPDCPHPTR